MSGLVMGEERKIYQKQMFAYFRTDHEKNRLHKLYIQLKLGFLIAKEIDDE